MKNLGKKLLFTCALFLLVPQSVNATAGGLKKASIITCNGVTYGTHSKDDHWHAAVKTSKGNYNATGDRLSQAPCAQNTEPPVANRKDTVNNVPVVSPVVEEKVEEEVSKSSDNLIKSIEVNGDNIEVNDLMSYVTVDENATIKIVLNDEKASLDYADKVKLDIGITTLTYKVIAEDESEKTYVLNIEREKILSSNTEIKVMINDEPVEFDKFHAEVVIDTDSKITYELVDDHAKTTLAKNTELLSTENAYLSFVVIAENGDIQPYSITVTLDSELSSDSLMMGTSVISLISGALLTRFYYSRKIKKQYKI